MLCMTTTRGHASMKLLITGGSGFIGSNLVRMAIARGHRVMNLDCLTYAGNPRSLADLENHENYSFSQTNVVDFDSVSRVFRDFRPDAVMHLAAESHVDRSIEGPGEFIQTNVVGTFNMLHASLEHFRELTDTEKQEFRFLHVSTDEVFGSLSSTGKFTEESSYRPHSPYSASKAASDHLSRAWSDTYGLPVLVANCSNNYGPFQFPEKLIPLVLLKCLKEEPIPVYGDGSNVRDWLFVEDHCRALLTILAKGTPGESYNIGGNCERSNLALVQSVCQVLDELHPAEDGKHHEEKITFVPDRPGHDFRYAMDTSKIQRELGWKPSEDIQSGLRKTATWYLNHRDWWEPILAGNYQLERLGRPLQSASRTH